MISTRPLQPDDSAARYLRPGPASLDYFRDPASAPCRINILGSTGSGATLLGLALAESTGVTVLDTDTYYWWPTQPPFRIRRTPNSRRDRLLDELARHQRVIVCGSVAGWGRALESSFDRVIALVPCRNVSGAHPSTPGWLVPRPNLRGQRRQDHWLSDCTCPVLRIDAELGMAARVEQALGFLGHDCHRQPPSLLRSQPITSVNL